jgi:hypothetical protein
MAAGVFHVMVGVVLVAEVTVTEAVADPDALVYVLLPE